MSICRNYFHIDIYAFNKHPLWYNINSMIKSIINLVTLYEQ